MATGSREASVKAESIAVPSQSAHPGDLYNVGSLPHQPADSQTLRAGTEEKVSVQSFKTEPFEERNAWDDVTVEVKIKKRETSPFPLLDAASVGSSSSSGSSLKRPRSESPLSDLSSDDETDVKMPILAPEGISKRVRKRVFMPLGELIPVSFDATGDPAAKDEMHTDLQEADDSRQIDMGVTMDGPDFRPQTPPTSPTRERVHCLNRAKHSTNTLRQGTSVTAEPRVKKEVVEDDDVIMINDLPPPEVQFPRAPETDDVKPKVEGFGEDVVQDRLARAGAKHFNIDMKAEDLEQKIHRYFICHKYGGGNQGNYLNASFENWKTHELSDFLFAGLDVHPSAPRFPGEPGLWCSKAFWTPPDGPIEKEDEWLKNDGTRMSNEEIRAAEIAREEVPKNRSGVWRLFVRFKENRIRFLGFYERIRTADLSTDEWLSQKPKFRSAWSRFLANHEWGRELRYRVKYRLDHGGNEPTRDEFSAAIADEGNQFKVVKPRDIEQDFNAGKEHLSVYVLNCVGFDRDFQKMLVSGNAAWEPGWQHDRAVRATTRAEEKEAEEAEKKRAIAAGEIKEEEADVEKKPRRKKARTAPAPKPGPKNAKGKRKPRR